MPKRRKGETVAATDGVTADTITTTGVARPKRARKRTNKAQAMLGAPRDGGAGPATRTEEEEPMLQPAVAQQRAGDVTQTGTPQHAGDTTTPITQLPAGETPPAPPLLLPASHTQQRAGDGQSSTLPHAGVEAATKQPTQQRVGGIPTGAEEQRWQALMAQMNALQSLMLQQQSEIKELRSHQQNITNSNVMASATTTNVPVTVETASVSSAPAASVSTTISVPSVTSSVTTSSGPSIDARDVMSIRSPTQTSVAASNVMPVVVSESQPIVDVPLQLGESESPMQVGSIGVQVLPDEPRPLLTAGMPLGHSLPKKIKQDIWEDKFVDLAALLYPDTHTSYGFRFSGDISDGQGELKLAPQRRKINTIADWSKAFSTFIAVYIEKPGREGDASQLLTYMAEVQSIAEDGLDWAMYDELYRRDRAGTKSPPSWAAINQSIHNKIMRQKSGLASASVPGVPTTSNFQKQPNPKQIRQQQGPFRQGNSIPPGFCYAYHTPEKFCMRQNCSYKHKCFKCRTGKNHPHFLCKQTKRDNQRPSNSD